MFDPPRVLPSGYNNEAFTTVRLRVANSPVWTGIHVDYSKNSVDLEFTSMYELALNWTCAPALSLLIYGLTEVINEVESGRRRMEAGGVGRVALKRRDLISTGLIEEDSPYTAALAKSDQYPHAITRNGVLLGFDYYKNVKFSKQCCLFFSLY